MRSTRRALRIVAGGILFALATYGILAAPGLVTDSAGTVPVQTVQKAAR